MVGTVVGSPAKKVERGACTSELVGKVHLLRGSQRTFPDLSYHDFGWSSFADDKHQFRSLFVLLQELSPKLRAGLQLLDLLAADARQGPVGHYLFAGQLSCRLPASNMHDLDARDHIIHPFRSGGMMHAWMANSCSWAAPGQLLNTSIDSGWS
jgi:hypothetical protein